MDVCPACLTGGGRCICCRENSSKRSDQALPYASVEAAVLAGTVVSNTFVHVQDGLSARARARQRRRNLIDTDQWSERTIRLVADEIQASDQQQPMREHSGD